MAKDASGDKWAQGLIYLANFNQPYALWMPALLLIALGAVLLALRSNTGWLGRSDAPSNYSWLARRVQSPTAVVIFMLVSGLLQALYWIRQGGDFMHGRVLLTPVFCLLAPVSVIPIVLPDGTRFSRGDGATCSPVRPAALWLALAGWSLWAANSPGMGPDATRVTYYGHRRRAAVLLPGHRPRAPVDRRRLPGLPADARGAGRDQQHPRRRPAAAVGQLRPMGCGAGLSAAATAARVSRWTPGVAK